MHGVIDEFNFLPLLSCLSRSDPAELVEDISKHAKVKIGYANATLFT